jgi:hypothetical protein
LTVAELAKYFGSDTNREGIRVAIMRNFSPDIKRLQECVKAGRDPKELNIGAEVAKSVTLHLRSSFLHQHNFLSSICVAFIE